MAHPKRKHSKARTHKKRTHKKLKAPNLVKCPQCRNLKLPFKVCPFCGYYKGRKVISIKEKVKKKR